MELLQPQDQALPAQPLFTWQGVWYSRHLMAAASAAVGPLGFAFQSYMGALQKRPLRTKALTSSVIAGCSDLIAQRLIYGKHKSLRRTGLMLLYGLLWNGPSAHYW